MSIVISSLLDALGLFLAFQAAKRDLGGRSVSPESRASKLLARYSQVFQRIKQSKGIQKAGRSS